MSLLVACDTEYVAAWNAFWIAFLIMKYVYGVSVVSVQSIVRAYPYHSIFIDIYVVDGHVGETVFCCQAGKGYILAVCDRAADDDC